MEITNNVKEIIVDAVDRYEVVNRALRVASENPSRTAYAEVDKFLAGINPAKECGF